VTRSSLCVWVDQVEIEPLGPSGLQVEAKMIVFRRAAIRGKIRGAIVRHLVLILARRRPLPDFEVSRANQPRESKSLYSAFPSGVFWLFRAIDQSSAVVGKKRAAVVAQLMRQLANIASRRRSSCRCRGRVRVDEKMICFRRG